MVSVSPFSIVEEFTDLATAKKRKSWLHFIVITLRNTSLQDFLALPQNSGASPIPTNVIVNVKLLETRMGINYLGWPGGCVLIVLRYA